MTWKIEWDERAIKDAKKLDVASRKRITKYLHKTVLKENDPRIFGKALVGNKAGLWRYRVGGYRIICKIEDKELTILVIGVGHRKNIYD